MLFPTKGRSGKPKMKVLYVCNASNFFGAGGMEYHLIDITKWMNDHGVETALAVRNGTYPQQHLFNNKSNLYPLSWTGLSKILSFFQVGKAMRDFSPDIISINRERDIVRIFFIAKLMSLFLKKKPKIISFFQNVGWTRYFILGSLDGVVFCTNYMKQGYLSKNKSAQKKSTVIYYGVKLPEIDLGIKFNPHRERRYFKGVDFPLIGMVGEMRKNQTELIDVAHHLKKKILNFTIAFIGRGKEEEITVLKRKIDRLGLTNNFIFTGRVERELIPDVFFDLDISVTTNRDEAFGIVHAESLASYTPLVAYNSGGPVEIVEKGGGILVNGGAEDMADKILSLITDDTLRTSLGKAGRTAVENHFSIDAMGEQFYNLYQSILEGTFPNDGKAP
jgi:glycosyltransferase involved in cell wall biosynthesis